MTSALLVATIAIFFCALLVGTLCRPIATAPSQKNNALLLERYRDALESVARVKAIGKLDNRLATCTKCGKIWTATACGSAHASISRLPPDVLSYALVATNGEVFNEDGTITLEFANAIWDAP